MKTLLKLSAFLLLISSCGQNGTDKLERPRETWVFRSVMDGKPRMATAALNENLWASYNTQTGTLFKAWKGGVDFDGAVYTTKHGPQPTTLGHSFLSPKEEWILVSGNDTLRPKVKYHGHTLKNGQVSFEIDLMGSESQTITIQETPEYFTRGGQKGMERVFNIKNPTSYQLGLKTSISNLQKSEDVTFTGNSIDRKSKIEEDNGNSFLDKEVTLMMGNEQEKLNVLFHPQTENRSSNSNENLRKDDERQQSLGAKLIDGSDCRACHNETVKTVGPSYLAIAERYLNDEASMKLLSEKIKLGGKGVWGEAVMTAHPNLSDDDISEMVKYILDLDKDTEAEGTKHPDELTLGLESESMVFKKGVSPNKGRGLVAKLYQVNPETRRDTTLEQTAILPKIHALQTSDFGEKEEYIKLVIRGTLEIEKSGSYDFRLISDDGSYLTIDDEIIIENGGFHSFTYKDGEVYLEKGKHEIRIDFEQGGGGAGLSLQWFDNKTESFVLIDDKNLSYNEAHFADATPLRFATNDVAAVKNLKPGDRISLKDVHPAFDLLQARPDDFHPRIGGLDVMDNGDLVVSTWDADGAVYLVKNSQSGDPSQMTVKKIAAGLAEPLGLKVVDGEIYVLQKQELTQLIDLDGDGVTDQYKMVSNDWKVSSNFHEFAFGLAYEDGHFYASLATAILPGGASANPQIPDRGKVVKINRETGATEFIAYGLRTPNGIGFNQGKELFIADNQGDWLPASKIVHIVEGQFYGSRSVDPEGTKGLQEKLPVVWLPQDEIGNSPSEPTYLNIGPYQNQLIHGEVTHGGIKRVAYEEVKGQLQGAVFRFIQGLEAGVNRLKWDKDGSLLVGGIGVNGNWQHYGKLGYGLQRLKFNGKSAFEMLKISSRKNGFVIEFTEPLADGIAAEEILTVKQWRYEPTIEYGGPKIDEKNLKSRMAKISSDRKTIYVNVSGLKENHLIYFLLNPELKSGSGKSLWTTEAWYTLNKISDDSLIPNN